MTLFGGRRRVEELEVELARTRAALAEAGGLDDLQRAQRRQAAELKLARVLQEEHGARVRLGQVQQELAGLQTAVIETRADALLQAAGVYDYVHPLDSAVAYKEQLTRLKADIKTEVAARPTPASPDVVAHTPRSARPAPARRSSGRRELPTARRSDWRHPTRLQRIDTSTP